MADLLEIALRKQRLIARCAQQRAELASEVEALRGPFALADRVMSAVRVLREHPVLVGAAVALVVALRRRSLFGLIARGFAAWRLWRQLNSWSQRLGVPERWRRRSQRAGHAP